MFGHGNERVPIRPGPVKAVAAVADADVVRLLAVQPFTPEDREQAEQDALVGDAIQVVELGWDVVFRPARILPVGARPQHRLLGIPARALDEVGSFPVTAVACLPSGNLAADAEHPEFAKRIVEERRAIAGQPCPAALAPVNTVGRVMQHQVVVVRIRQLVTAIGIALRQVEPHGRRVAMTDDGDVRAGHHIQ